MFRRLSAIFILIFSLVLASQIASAMMFEYTPNSITIMNTSETAAFTVSIGNDNSKFNDTFRFGAVDVNWAVQSDPLEDYLGGVSLMPGQTKQINLVFKPISGMSRGPKKVELLVKSELTGVTESKYFYINVGESEPSLKEYLAAVSKILDMPTKIDPREPVVIRLNLENKNPKNIQAMTIDLNSRLIKKQEITSLEPLASKNVAITINLDPNTPPQQDVMRVSLIVDGKTLQPLLEEKYEIIGYSTIVEQDLPKQEAFLKNTKGRTYFNDGNMKASKQVLEETNFFSRFFTSTEPQAYIITKNGKQYLTWDVELAPKQTRQITVAKDYRLLFLIVILALLTSGFYYVLRSPVLVRKEATVVGIKEGGISELRVLIHIKNRTGTTYENLIVTDKIPHIADLDEDVEVGTLKPTKSVRHRDGVVIKWELPSLEKYEERILSYKMKSKLTILGGFALPRAIAKFSHKGGKEKTAKSETVKVEI